MFVTSRFVFLRPGFNRDNILIRFILVASWQLYFCHSHRRSNSSNSTTYHRISHIVQYTTQGLQIWHASSQNQVSSSIIELFCNEVHKPLIISFDYLHKNGAYIFLLQPRPCPRSFMSLPLCLPSSPLSFPHSLPCNILPPPRFSKRLKPPLITPRLKNGLTPYSSPKLSSPPPCYH
jgi:hypothetical protein